MDPLPTIADVFAAAERLHGVAVRTPLLISDRLDGLTGARVLVKAEPLQRTGSFKLRGAYNTISQIDAPAVVAYSSGNHAQGVAAAAKLLGKRATIVMPADAPAIKRASTAWWGAEIRIYDRERESREAIGEEIAARTGAALIRPYDDPRIIAGQGTLALEAVEQAGALDLVPDLALIGCGGGGLISGSGLVLRDAWPGIEIFAVEPEGFDDTRRSLEAGRRVKNDRLSGSFCDALLSPMPGELTFALNRRQLAGGLTVDDAEVAEAMRFAFEALKVVVEPGGAVALAALLAGRIEARGRTVLVVLSGGNVDPVLFADVLEGGRER
ncbi:MAG TPA: threonine/serine dehydratase [Geminicoccaceae bacterium]